MTEPSSLEARVRPRAWPYRPAKQLVRSVAVELYRHHAFDHAATMAFYFFLGLVPLLVFGGLLLGELVSRAGADALAAPLYGALPGVTAELLRAELHAIANAPSDSMAPLSLLGFVWLTSNGFHNLMDVFELLIGAPPRAWWRQRVIALAWVGGTLVAVVLALGLVLMVNGALDGIHNVTQLPLLVRNARDRLAEGWRRTGLVAVVLTLCTLGLATFYRVAVTYPGASRRRVWPGTVTAILLWVLVTWLFGTYVRTIGDYAVYYGSVAAVAVTLLWLYLTSLALLLGAEVNAYLEGARASLLPPPSSARG